MPQALNYLISKVESLEELVNELSIQKDTPEQPEWMDIDGLRQYLPSHPAKQTIYGWVNDKLGRFAVVGDSFSYGRVDVVVKKATEYTVKELEVKYHPRRKIKED